MRDVTRIDGAALKRFRIERDLTQAQLAASALVSIATVSRLENGGERAHIGTVIRLINALGIGIHEIIRLPHLNTQATPSLKERIPVSESTNTSRQNQGDS
jgi:transcriptional regulator with XRE-family HTH domain